MLRKLIKHEFRATSRIMWPIFGGMVALTILMRFAAIPISSSSDNPFLNILSGLIIAGFVIGLLALTLMPLIVSSARFKNSILGDEGYLTMTLPVSTNKLLLSKLIVNAVWYVLSALVMLFIFLLLVLSCIDSDSFSLSGFFRELFDALGKLSETGNVGQIVLIIVEILLNIVAYISVATLLVYAAFSIGYSANRHKNLWTVLLIYGFYHALSYCGIATGVAFANEAAFNNLLRCIESFLGISLGVVIIIGVIFYFVTKFFITRKLNLE